MDKCSQVEGQDGSDSKMMFQTIWDITGEKRLYREEIIKDRDGNKLTIKMW